MAKVTIIVAVGKNGEIGKENNLIWHFREDMRHFKRTTVGNTVIMGRKTWLSLPNGALPDRRNIVLTTSSDFTAEGAETADSLAKALRMSADENVFIIGGETVYRQSLPFADEVILTSIDAECKDADAWFPMNFYDEFEVSEESEPITDKSGISFRFATYRRK